MGFFTTAFSTITFYAILGGAIFWLPLIIGTMSLSVFIAFAAFFAFVSWLAGPFVIDGIFARLYGMQWITMAELRHRSPGSASFIEDACTRHSFKLPRLGLIKDPSPNSFVYGHGRWDARLVVTEGLFSDLYENERVSVFAHEIGHIKSRDFVVMTPMSALLQSLFELCLRFKFLKLPLGGLHSVLEFAALPLSRHQEYCADKYATQETHNNHLSMALLKISYGIMNGNRRLADSAKYIGITGVESAASGGIAYHNAKSSRSFESIKKGFLYDIVNPWASFAELGRAHPLLGKRLGRLSEAKNGLFDFASLEKGIDANKLRAGFAKDVAVMAVPLLLSVGFPLAYLALAFVGNSFRLDDILGGWLIIAGIANLVIILYKYPSGTPRTAMAIELAADPYASLVRGKAVLLRGRIMDSVMGSVFQDKTGLVQASYEASSPFGPSCKELVGKYAKVTGWFVRDASGILIVDAVESSEGKAGGFVKWRAVLESCVLMLGVIIALLII